MWRTGVAGLSIVLLCGVFSAVEGAERHIHQGQSIQAGLSGLKPGDTLVVHAGTYRYARIEDLNGSSEGWITIRGAEDEARPVVHYLYTDRKVIHISDSSYIRIQGLEITGGLGGVDFGSGTSHDIVLEDLYIHDVGGVGIGSASATEIYNVTIRGCEITGTAGTGEGICLGMSGRWDRMQAHDCLIERNFIHDTAGAGIDLRHGCYGNVLQDNVISVTTGGPAIISRGTYKNDPAYNNVVRRNLIVGSSSAGIHAASETDIENNVVVNSLDSGIRCQGRDTDGKMQYVRIVNNTVYLAGGDAVYLAKWGSGQGLQLGNNLIYQEDLTGSAVNAVNGLAGATVRANLYYGAVTNAAVAGLTKGPVATAVFVNPSPVLAEMNLYLTSINAALDAGDGDVAAGDDYNLRGRPYGGGVDIGAYERRGNENPGGLLALDFKTVMAPDYAGDLDGNGQVDVADLMILVEAWGALSEGAGWDARADVDGDGRVAIFDLMAVVMEFGKN